MQFFTRSTIGIGLAAVFAAVLCPTAPGQDTPKGLPPRTSPAEYQARGQAGKITIAAEFTRHSVAMPENTYTTEDYVVVEVGFFGPAETRLKLSHDDFSLRVNGKKVALPAQQYGAIFRSLKDPLWVPPEGPASKSKTSIGSGGDQSDPGATPAPVHMPFELERAMQLRVQKAAMPEGERPLPAAGLIFFVYRGRAEGIHQVELVYAGAAGKAVLALHP